MHRVLRAIAAFAVVSVITPVTCVMVILAALIFLPLPATLPQPKPVLESGITHVLDSAGNEIGVYKHFETYLEVAPSDIPRVGAVDIDARVLVVREGAWLSGRALADTLLAAHRLIARLEIDRLRQALFSLVVVLAGKVKPLRRSQRWLR